MIPLIKSHLKKEVWKPTKQPKEENRVIIVDM